MTTQSLILFCENPIKANKVDPDFEDEFKAAKQNGFEILIFNFEHLTYKNNTHLAIKRIVPSTALKTVIYRGWMLTPTQYLILYNELLAKNYKLINTTEEYQNCHYLPDSLKYIANKTPKTIFEKIENEQSIELLIEKSKIFNANPVILKDYVKSEKHNWDNACFVTDASSTIKLKDSINNLIKLRGDYLNEGIVIREFVALNNLTIHSKSGMPLTEEYRLFFYNKKLIGIYDYWEEGEYAIKKPNTNEFEELAKHIESNFFSMDIARKTNGELTIIELGDGQVSGLPDKLDRFNFYSQLKNRMCNLDF
jgi:ATP-grasp domain, R2K clade family 2